MDTGCAWERKSERDRKIESNMNRFSYSRTHQYDAEDDDDDGGDKQNKQMNESISKQWSKAQLISTTDEEAE